MTLYLGSGGVRKSTDDSTATWAPYGARADRSDEKVDD